MWWYLMYECVVRIYVWLGRTNVVGVKLIVELDNASSKAINDGYTGILDARDDRIKNLPKIYRLVQIVSWSVEICVRVSGGKRLDGVD